MESTCELTSADERLVQLVEITGCEPQAAAALLEMSHGDAALAAELYFEGALGARAAVPLSAVPRDVIEDQLGHLHQTCPRLRDEAELRELMVDDKLARRLRGEFCWSLSFDRSFVSALLYEGFLPISSECGARLGFSEGVYVLQPKLHVQRCILDFDRLHVSRKAKKAARRYTLTISTAFDDVLAACVEQHGENWLYPPMRAVYSSMCALPQPGACTAQQPVAISFELWSECADADAASNPEHGAGGDPSSGGSQPSSVPSSPHTLGTQPSAAQPTPVRAAVVATSLPAALPDLLVAAARPPPLTRRTHAYGAREVALAGRGACGLLWGGRGLGQPAPRRTHTCTYLVYTC